MSLLSAVTWLNLPEQHWEWMLLTIKRIIWKKLQNLRKCLSINSYLPLMDQEARAFSKKELIVEIISKKIPTA